MEYQFSPSHKNMDTDGMSSAGEDTLVILPQHDTGKIGFGMDIGGSLIKFVYITDEGDNVRIHFLSFPKEDIDAALITIRDRFGQQLIKLNQIVCTGLGCTQYTMKINQVLGVKVKILVEFDCFANSLKFLLKHKPISDIIYPPSTKAQPYIDEMTKGLKHLNEIRISQISRKQLEGNKINTAQNDDVIKDCSHTKSDCVSMLGAHALTLIDGDQIVESEPLAKELPSTGQADYIDNCNHTKSAKSDDITQDKAEQNNMEEMFPVLLCIIGSGLVCLKFDLEGIPQAIHLNTSGGRTLLGLGSLLTGAKSFDELLSLAQNGDASKVEVCAKDMKNDLDQEDFYSLIPSICPLYAFGHAVNKNLDDFKREDLAAAVVSQVSQMLASTCHLAHMACKDVKTVFFCGSVCGTNQHLRDVIIQYYGTRSLSGSFEIKRPYYFLRYGGFLGALGCLLSTLEKKYE